MMYSLPTLVLLSLVQASSSIAVVSYNQYWWNVRQNGRFNELYSTVGRNQADLYGFQECENVNDVMYYAGLSGYQTFQGPNKPSGNPAPLAWKSSVFTAISGPSSVQVASDQYGARYVNWVRLYHRSSGRNIFFGNTHGPLGQCGSRTLAANWASAITRNKRDGDVVIVTGDWNCGFGDVALTQVRSLLSYGVKSGIDMILTSVSASGGPHSGGPSDHRLVKADVYVGGGGNSNPTCSNRRSDYDCNYWKQTGECNSNYEGMKYYCPASCGYCGLGNGNDTVVPPLPPMPPTNDTNSSVDDNLPFVDSSVRAHALCFLTIAASKLLLWF